MKRICILLMGAAALLSSCNTLTRTARTAETQSYLQSATVVDIVPATEERITHTLTPDLSLLRGGENNVKQAVEHEALVKYGNADILLEPQYIIHKERKLIGSKITSITVSGRPAYYTNYRTLHDSVWCNPVFRGVYQPKALPLAASKNPLAILRKPTSKTPTSSIRTKGFTKGASLFLGGEDDDFACGVLLNAGYQFNPYLEVGAGVGLDFWALELDDIPLFGYVRVNLSKKEKHFYLDYKVGGDLLDLDAMMGFAVGYCFGKFDVAFHMTSYSGSYEYYNDGYYDYYYGGYYGGYYETRSYYENQFGVSFNFRF